MNNQFEIDITPNTQDEDIVYFENVRSDNGDIHGIDVTKQYLLTSPEGSRKTAFGKGEGWMRTHLFEILKRTEDKILCKTIVIINLVKEATSSITEEYVLFNVSK